MKLKVLWIDDVPNEAFMDRAYEKDIVITNKKMLMQELKRFLHQHPRMMPSCWMQIA